MSCAICRLRLTPIDFRYAAACAIRMRADRWRPRRLPGGSSCCRPGCAGQAPPQKRPDAPQLAPYVPTPQEVVDRMLQLAGVGKADVVYDLGCGDGRIPITAAKVYGARGVGVDIDPQRIAEANANAKQAGVTHLVTFRLQDAMTTDLSRGHRRHAVSAVRRPTSSCARF